MKSLKKSILPGLAALSLMLGVASLYLPARVGAIESKEVVCNALDDSSGTTECGGGTGQSIPEIIGSVISILIIIIGAVSVIMIIIGGLRYILSNGDSNGVQGAKNTILYAIVGLAIALSAQVLVAFVINKS